MEGTIQALNFIEKYLPILKKGWYKFSPNLYKYARPLYRNNLFQNAFKTLDRDRKPIETKTILDYNYKNYNTPFVGREASMQAIDTFMTDKQPFLWYTMYGEAGAGKSRFALELCKRYRELNWNCGFIDWDKLSKDEIVWESWRPKSSTLIVVDYAKNYLQNKTYPAQHDEGFPNLVSALKILMQHSGTFKSSVRFLFLERGQEQDVTQSHTIELFHVQLVDENNSLRSELRQSCYDYKKPLFLKGLESDMALQELAESIIEKQWPDYCPPIEFLARLENFDAKKRPLFAIILAYMLRSSKTEVSKEKEDILQGVMRETFAPSKYPNLCCEDVYLLMLATMCGGLQSLPKTGDMGLSFSLPDIWNDNKIRAKYLSLGFAKKENDKDGREICILLPLEPDLIGEFFVLNGFKNVCASLSSDEDLPLNVLQDLAFIAWCHVLHNTEETFHAHPLHKLLDFFSRCGDDFANDQLKDVIISLVKQFQKSPDATLRGTLCVIFAGFLTYIIGTYGKVGKSIQAQQIFDSMASLGDNEEIMIARANASVNLIYAYIIATVAAGTASDLPKVQAILDAMASLGDNEEIIIARAKASFNLIYIFGIAGIASDLPKAQTIFDAMASLGDNEEMMILRAMASAALIYAYYNTGTASDLSKVQTIFDAMANLGNHEEVVRFRTVAQTKLNEFITKF